MVKEHEVSFVFTHESIKKIQTFLLGKVQKENIHDLYIDKSSRIRKHTDDWCMLTAKSGDKKNGYRYEIETPIDCSVYGFLKNHKKLEIIKTRHIYEHSDYNILIDIIEHPMNLAILEIESFNSIIPADIDVQLFGTKLIPCELSSFDLFKRKIGFLGAPSSGKTESAKYISNALNTVFGAKSFYVPEFATNFIQKYKRIPTINDQFLIWHAQYLREKSADDSHIVVSDCPSFLSLIYGQRCKKDESNVSTSFILSELYERSLGSLNDYTDLVFFKLLNYSENGIRYNTQEEALDIENRIKQFLVDHGVRHLEWDYTQKEKLIQKLFYINS